MSRCTETYDALLRFIDPLTTATAEGPIIQAYANPDHIDWHIYLRLSDKLTTSRLDTALNSMAGLQKLNISQAKGHCIDPYLRLCKPQERQCYRRSSQTGGAGSDELIEIARGVNALLNESQGEPQLIAIHGYDLDAYQGADRVRLAIKIGCDFDEIANLPA